MATLTFPIRAFVLLLIAAFTAGPGLCASYAVVISKQSYGDPEWKQVADELTRKHDGQLVVWEEKVSDSHQRLAELHPKYTCFVAPWQQVSRKTVAVIHQLCRRLDKDPYCDTRWGIVTGVDASAALAIAKHRDPLTVRRISSGTEFAIDLCESGQWFDELVQHKHVLKEKGQAAQQLRGPADTTEALVASLNDYQPDLFITSGHATERDWQIGFRFRAGSFRSDKGQLYGLDIQGKRHEIESRNAKVYLPIGNCLMGHIDSADAMALAWMNDAGVKQMIGYTVPTWFGYAGWGVLDYFVEQPGRYTLTDAFFANQHALIHEIQKLASDDQSMRQRGLKFDRDVVAFYGDPAWHARMAPAECAYEQLLDQTDGTYTLDILPAIGEKSFEPVNTNGSQRGWRPIIAWLPERIGAATVIEGSDLSPVITDDFILVPNPRQCDPDKTYRIVFKAEKR